MTLGWTVIWDHPEVDAWSRVSTTWKRSQEAVAWLREYDRRRKRRIWVKGGMVAQVIQWP